MLPDEAEREGGKGGSKPVGYQKNHYLRFCIHEQNRSFGWLFLVLCVPNVSESHRKRVSSN